MQLTGIFQITDWQESTQKQFDNGTKLNIANVSQTYSGDILGKSKITYQLNYQVSGDAHFNGFEYINCVINKLECELVLKHDGQFTNGIASGNFLIISSHPIKQLIGKTGYFKSTSDGQAEYKLT